MEELKKLNDDNKKIQSEVDNVLPYELEVLKKAMNQQFQHLTEEFTKNQIDCAEKVTFSFAFE